MARKAKQWKPEPVVLTYEEQAVLNWYKAKKAYMEDMLDPARAAVFRAAEDVLAQIAIDVNVKNG